MRRGCCSGDLRTLGGRAASRSLGRAPVRRLRGRQSGFTLTELLAGLSIATLVLALALPVWKGWLAEQRARNVGSRLLAGLVAARTAAVSNGAPVRVCPVSVSGGCATQRDWSGGWLALQSSLSGWRTLLDSGLRAGGVRVEVNATALEPGVAFDTRGFAVQTGGGGFASGSWVVCASGARTRTVTLAPSGRARISTGSICS